MFDIEIDSSKYQSGKGKNFFELFPNIRVPYGVGESNRGRRAKIMCIDDVWFDFNYDPPKFRLDNHTSI